jgi:hypothetical protein
MLLRRLERTEELSRSLFSSFADPLEDDVTRECQQYMGGYRHLSPDFELASIGMNFEARTNFKGRVGGVHVMLS